MTSADRRVPLQHTPRLDGAIHDPSVAPRPLPGPGPEPGEPAGFTLARLTLLVVITITVARTAGFSAGVGWAVLTAVVIWSVVLAGSIWTALAAAAVAWLLGTGFLIDRLGVLGFGPADRARLAVLVVAAVGAVLIGRRAGAHSGAR